MLLDDVVTILNRYSVNNSENELGEQDAPSDSGALPR